MGTYGNSFVNDVSLQLSGNEASFRSERLYVNKLNVILVQVSAALPDNMQCIYLVAVSLFGFCTNVYGFGFNTVHSTLLIFRHNIYSDIAQIVKHDWPAKWTSFIPDLVAAAKTSETICENCMIILKVRIFT